MREDIIERLIALRKKAGLTANDVSLKLGHTRFYISRMENGVFFPSVNELENILNLYGSTLEELFYSEFEEFHFEKSIIEKLRSIGKHEKDAVLGVLYLAFEKCKTENKTERKGVQ